MTPLRRHGLAPGQHKPVPRKDVRPLVIGVACWNHVGVHRVLMVFRKPLSVFMRRDDGRRRLPHLFDQRASGAEHGVRGLGCLQQCFCFTKLVDGIFLKFRVCSALPLPPSCTRRTQINARRKRQCNGNVTSVTFHKLCSPRRFCAQWSVQRLVPAPRPRRQRGAIVEHTKSILGSRLALRSCFSQRALVGKPPRKRRLLFLLCGLYHLSYIIPCSLPRLSLFKHTPPLAGSSPPPRSFFLEKACLCPFKHWSSTTPRHCWRSCGAAACLQALLRHLLLLLQCCGDRRPSPRRG